MGTLRCSQVEAVAIVVELSYVLNVGEYTELSATGTRGHAIGVERWGT